VPLTEYIFCGLCKDGQRRRELFSVTISVTQLRFD